MTELFLDIESAPNMEKEEFFAAKREIESGSLTKQSDPARYWKYSVGALNPYEGKAIFIAYRISSIGHNHIQLHQITDTLIVIVETLDPLEW